MGARAWPQGGAFAPVPKVRAAELASLRQSSPSNQVRDWGAATPAGAMRWRHGMARGTNAKYKDTGSRIKSGMTEGERGLAGFRPRTTVGHGDAVFNEPP